MSTRGTAAIAISLALLSGRALAAQDGECKHIDRVLEEAASDFQGIAQPTPNNPEGVSLTLAGAKECTLRDAVYECEWIVESPDKGIDEFAALAESLQSCLTPRKFEITRQSDLFSAHRPGTASVMANWSREFLAIYLQVEKEK